MLNKYREKYPFSFVEPPCIHTTSPIIDGVSLLPAAVLLLKLISRPMRNSGQRIGVSLRNNVIIAPKRDFMARREA